MCWGKKKMKSHNVASDHEIVTTPKKPEFIFFNNIFCSKYTYTAYTIVPLYMYVGTRLRNCRVCGYVYSPRDAGEMRTPLLFRNENAQKVRRREHGRKTAAEMTRDGTTRPTCY